MRLNNKGSAHLGLIIIIVILLAVVIFLLLTRNSGITAQPEQTPTFTPTTGATSVTTPVYTPTVIQTVGTVPTAENIEILEPIKEETVPMIWSNIKRDSMGGKNGYSMTSSMADKSENKISEIMYNNDSFKSQGFSYNNGGDGMSYSYSVFSRNIGGKKQILHIGVGDLDEMHGVPISYGVYVFLSDLF